MLLCLALFFPISCKEKCIDEGPVLHKKVMPVEPNIVPGKVPLLITISDIGQRCQDSDMIPASKLVLIVEHSNNSGLTWQEVLNSEIAIASFPAAGSVTEHFNIELSEIGTYRFHIY